MARHERRRRLKELRKIIKAIELRGIGHRPAPVEIAALVALIDAKLDAAFVPGRSSKISATMSGLLDKSIGLAPAYDRIACKAGCYYCCDIYVSAPAPQIFAIADHIRRNAKNIDAEAARIDKASEMIQGKAPAERLAEHVLCTFLNDGLCGIYPVRPPACRAHSSLSLEACEAGFRGETEEIPVPDYTNVLRGGYEQALSAALHHRGLPTFSYEMSHAVLVALRDPDAEEKWFRGEDVFAGVATDEADQPSNPEMINREISFWNALCNVARGEALPPGPLAGMFPAWVA